MVTLYLGHVFVRKVAHSYGAVAVGKLFLMRAPREISNLNQHPREGDGCCERVLAHDAINAASLLCRRAQSSWVHILCNKMSVVDNDLYVH